MVNRLTPYTPGEQPQGHQYIKLNTNESPYPPSSMVTSAIQNYNMDNLRRYPDPNSKDLRQVLADYHRLQCDQIFVGNGSDEILAHAFQAFFIQPEPVLFPDISYSFYAVYCALYDIKYETVALDDEFNVDISQYNYTCGGIILPNPNAPTGIALTLSSIKTLVETAGVVVIIDEAYVDFGADSADSLINVYDNLLIVRTFSKSRSLAGLRLGYALGNVNLIEALNRVKNSFNSYPVDQLANVAAIASIKDNSYFEHCNQQVMLHREYLSQSLQMLGFRVYPSSSNFILAEHPVNAAIDLYQSLKRVGILVRHFNVERINNCLRISVGNEQECMALITALKQILLPKLM